MKINELWLADCEISGILLEDSSLTINATRAYCIEKRMFLNNVTITIKNWEKLDVFKYITTPLDFRKYSILKLALPSCFEPLALIQEMDFINNMIILKGFSKQSGKWLEYEITNAKNDIVVCEF